MSDLQSKTDEELNVMLAELVGWRYEPFDHWIDPQGNSHGCFGAGDELEFLPRYSTSLDEVAKVEAGLTDEENDIYWKELWLTIRKDGEILINSKALIQLIKADALAKTIALLRTKEMIKRKV